MSDPGDPSSTLPDDARAAARASQPDPARRRTLGLLLIAVFIALLAWDAAPDASPAYFFDSKAYMLWPEMPGPEGALIPSKRPPSYPLTIDVLGHKWLLGFAQAGSLLASFLVLGHVVAGRVGLVVFGLLSRAFPVACWSGAVLTESLTLAALALLLALAIWLGDRRRGLRGEAAPLDRPAVLGLVTAAVLAAYFAFLRDANFMLLPLFGVAFVRGPWKIAVAAGVLAITLAATSFTLSERESRWHPNIATAIGVRVRADRDAFAELKAKGMPTMSFAAVTPEMAQWMDEAGRSLYQRWVLTRPASYVEPLPRLVAREAPAEIRQHYFEDAPASGWSTRVGNRLWQILAPPFWLWLGLLAVPIVEWYRRREVSALGALAALCVPIAYGFSFATYHAAAIEVTRHMLAAIVLYRIATVVGLAALARVWLPTQSAHETSGVP